MLRTAGRTGYAQGTAAELYENRRVLPRGGQSRSSRHLSRIIIVTPSISTQEVAIDKLIIYRPSSGQLFIERSRQNSITYRVHAMGFSVV